MPVWIFERMAVFILSHNSDKSKGKETQSMGDFLPVGLLEAFYDKAQ